MTGGAVRSAWTTLRSLVRQRVRAASLTKVSDQHCSSSSSLLTDTVAVLEEVQENLKHFGFYRHELSRPPQLTACLIESVVVKVIEHSTLLNLIRRAD